MKKLLLAAFVWPISMAASTATEITWQGAVLPGRFGLGLDASLNGAEAAKPSLDCKTLPLTVELWAKFGPLHGGFHTFPPSKNPVVFAAYGPRESADHWELSAKPGKLTAYLPGMTPELVESKDLRSIGDGKWNRSIGNGGWHHVAMVIEEKQVVLYVDGAEVGRAEVARKPGGTVLPGVFRAGKARLAPGESLHANEVLIDEVRLSNVAREFHGVPTAPSELDASTIGLWHFDRVEAGGIFADAANKAGPLRAAPPPNTSLNEIEKATYRAGVSPLAGKADVVALVPGAVNLPARPASLSLDGEWQLCEGAEADWGKAIAAPVPGGVHTALYNAGVIPFPYEGRNQEIAARWSQKTYWYRRTFPRPPAGQDQTLVFHGICNRCAIWLNGKELGRHEGMFSRVVFPVRELLQDTNTLIVELDPAIDCTKTVVFMNSYGGHYAKFPPLGIWQPVEIRGEPTVAVRDPFVATRDIRAGRIDLAATLAGPDKGWRGRLSGVITPENFSGAPLHFEYPVAATTAVQDVHLQFDVPSPRLWWPIDLGEPNLYRLELAFLPEGGGVADVRRTTFGIRTVETAPVAGTPRPRQYNWQFVINGKPVFIKGTGWCTPDAMMDFNRARYDRFLTLAAAEHVQMLRAWGVGLVETEDFYDLCNRKGILVMQEWPTGGLSHKTQPLQLLEDTVREGILRLRSHPSLALYGAGNESREPWGPAIDMMGRLAIELDGTRDFHSGEPRGGSEHNYNVWWRGQPIDAAIQFEATFFGEFGIASSPNYESVQRYLPADEKAAWPPPPDRAFAYHTPVFNTMKDMERLTRMSRLFTKGDTMERFILGTQLAQAVGVRHTLERARARWPECTGALFYKLNDNCPAVSWSTVDWYGAPKIAHYLIQDSFAPLVAVALLPRATTYGEPLSMPVFLLDDADALADGAWEVRVRAYASDLRPLQEQRFSGKGSIQNVAKLGEFTLTAEQTRTSPLFVVTEVFRGDVLAKRNHHFSNFESRPDCLFDLPKTRLGKMVGDGKVTVKNEGPLPAFGVNIARKGHLDTFVVAGNYFWLDPGETKTVTVNSTEGISVDAWNAHAAR